MLYDSLDTLPQYNWIKLSERFDAKYLFSDNNIDEKLAIETFKKLQEDYFVKYGNSEQMQEYYRLLKKIIELTADEAIYNDPATKIYLKEAQNELKNFTKSVDKVDYNDICAKVSKFMGFRIDLKLVSVTEYQSYIKEYKNHLTKITTNGKKNK